ncbi:S66 peptidase family protein [Fodinibius sediminis]|uniref:Muramoyltetrapeptide carboxypeptidase n=1 Tax=Fodinibius sediminis TaxID=1214077 RepID=A0A521DC71_9BACT|nr:LD-carboxypeptidase [Fodinibius sediminis]SMO69236.1 muramoyltetrapeptide carboxypeptidase [Fodinibius sediminis]
MNRETFLQLIGIGGMAPFFNYKAAMVDGKGVIKPKALSRGDTIGLISPAGIIGDDTDYDKIVERIQQLGYKTKEGANARRKYGYLAGTDEQRAADLNAMFADPSVDAVMPFRGGWGCNRILDLINYELIQKHPKILVGFSDITSLLLAIQAKTGLTTFHGPVAKVVWTTFTKRHFHKLLGSSALTTLRRRSLHVSKEYDRLNIIRPGQARGRLLGGNLSVLTAMIGSDYLPEWEGSILFLEDVGEDVYRIDRMLTQLKLSGILDRISALVFGQCTACDISDEHGFTLREILDQHIKPLQIPAFSGALFGHIDHMGTLPVGISAELNAGEGSITLLESAVRT